MFLFSFLLFISLMVLLVISFVIFNNSYSSSLSPSNISISAFSSSNVVSNFI